MDQAERKDGWFPAGVREEDAMYKFQRSWKGLYTGSLGGWLDTAPRRQEECLHGPMAGKRAWKKSIRRMDAGAGNTPVMVWPREGVEGLNVLAMRYIGNRRRKAG